MMPINALRLRQTTLTEKMRVLFALTSAKGYMLRADDKNTLFQSSAGTTAVVNVSDPVGYATDLSGNGNHFTQATSGNRTLWNGSGIDFDGINDGLSRTALDLSGTTYVYLAFTGQKVTGDNNACIMFHAAVPTTTDGTIALWANGGSAINFQHNMRGTSPAAQARITQPSDVLASTVAFWNLSATGSLDAQLDVYLNGVAQTISAGAAAGTGTLTTQNHYLGNSTTAGQEFAGKGKRYAVLATTSPLTAAQLALVIAWAEEGRV